MLTFRIRFRLWLPDASIWKALKNGNLRLQFWTTCRRSFGLQYDPGCSQEVEGTISTMCYRNAVCCFCICWLYLLLFAWAQNPIEMWQRERHNACLLSPFFFRRMFYTCFYFVGYSGRTGAKDFISSLIFVRHCSSPRAALRNIPVFLVPKHWQQCWLPELNVTNWVIGLLKCSCNVIH